MHRHSNDLGRNELDPVLPQELFTIFLNKKM